MAADSQTAAVSNQTLSSPRSDSIPASVFGAWKPRAAWARISRAPGILPAHRDNLPLVIRVGQGPVPHHVQRNNQPPLVRQLPDPFGQVRAQRGLQCRLPAAVEMIRLEADDPGVVQARPHRVGIAVRFHQDQPAELRVFSNFRCNERVGLRRIAVGRRRGNEQRPLEPVLAHLPADHGPPRLRRDHGRTLRIQVRLGVVQVPPIVQMGMNIKDPFRQEPLHVAGNLPVHLPERPILHHYAPSPGSSSLYPPVPGVSRKMSLHCNDSCRKTAPPGRPAPRRRTPDNRS